MKFEEIIPICNFAVSRIGVISNNLPILVNNQAVSGSNAQLLGGTVNYLCNGEKTSAAVQTKSLQVKYLTLTDRAANIWTAICVFTLPLLFIIAGLAVWASRRKR